MSILTVSQLNRYAASILREDSHLRTIFIRGEIANFNRNFRSGHCYFSIRDEEASVRAVMFQSSASRLRFQPKDGMHVILQGSVTLYERDGTFQINAFDMQPEGIGAQALALQQRREKLAKLGYFSAERKRPIPPFPNKIGIVTSRSGAALQDMINVLSRRYPIAEVCLFPALVQGENAPASIAEALHYAGQNGCDVILMGRGGGSNEDLSAFQSEEVAQAVFCSPVPVISAVGHETDHCIADEVADLRAPTPSAAAELAVPDCRMLASQIEGASARLARTFTHFYNEKQFAFQNMQHRLQQYSPAHMVRLRKEQFAAACTALKMTAQKVMDEKKQEWLLLTNRLESVSPVAILQRGYALVHQNQNLICCTEDIQVGDQVQITLADGSFTAAVSEIHKGDSK
ncbi:MAG: exodeoxyribonuclease VII large subunit [Oscillospiraceae bacterium]|nr:exodeoxyribonuclease VII large subunit [Oscillospiraceae bacterium]